jgi:ectoine hydroxylase-related dioxygenase (phytanoyl-CoA dioxygenase family)
MSIPRLKWSAEPSMTDGIAEALDESGCCVIEQAVDVELMEAISGELAMFDAAGSIGASAFEGYTTRRTGAPLPRSATFRSIAMHPAVIAAGDHALASATSWRFSAAEYIQIGPGETAQRLHRDQWKYDQVDFPNDVELNGMWAITDFTEANGATRVVPGSHRGSNAERFTHTDTEPAEMPAGSLLLYTGRLYHGGGANATDRWRCGLSLQHAVSWLTQSTNQFLECPPAVVREWPEDLARFIGYAKAGNGLGYWRDSEDPLAAVHPDRIFERGWATVRSD